MTDFIKSLELSVRASNVLRNMLDPIDGHEKFLALTPERVLAQPRAGRRTWTEIKHLQDILRGEGAVPQSVPHPKHPTALPDKVAQKLVDLARAHGYGIEKMRLSWVTTLGCPLVMAVEYDGTTARQECDTAQPPIFALRAPDAATYEAVKEAAKKPLFG